MTRFAEVGKRLRARRAESLFNLFFAICVLAVAFVMQRAGVAVLFVGFGVCFLTASAVCFWLSRQLPIRDILQFAQAKHGLATLSEITTALDVDPALVVRTLRKLQALGMASPQWQEFRKNLWEFPDYLPHALDGLMAKAQESGGRVTLQDLLAAGNPADSVRSEGEGGESAMRDGAAAAPDARPGVALETS
jgi:hypothetical protein